MKKTNELDLPAFTSTLIFTVQSSEQKGYRNVQMSLVPLSSLDAFASKRKELELSRDSSELVISPLISSHAPMENPCRSPETNHYQQHVPKITVLRIKTLINN
jgi:hypothetical protein